MSAEDIKIQYRRILNRIGNEIEYLEKLKPESAGADGRISIASEVKDESGFEDSDSTIELDLTCQDNNKELELSDENFSEWQKSHDEAEKMFSEWQEWREAVDRIQSRIYILSNAASKQLISLIRWYRFPDTEEAYSRTEEFVELVKWWRTVSYKIREMTEIGTAVEMVDKRIRETMKRSNKADDPLMSGFVDELTFSLAKVLVRFFVTAKFPFAENALDEVDRCEKELKKIESSIHWLRKQVRIKSSGNMTSE